MHFIPNKTQVIKDLKILAKIPFTLLIVVATIIAGIATKALWIPAEGSAIADRYGYGLAALKEGHFLNIITGMLVVPEPWMYALVVPLLALGAGFLEYRYGAARMLVAVFATHIGAVLGVAGLLQLCSQAGMQWATTLAQTHDVGSSNSAFGVIGAASAALPLLWRRRIRAGFFLYCLTFVLYSGVIWDLTHFAGLLIGFAIGPWVVGRKYDLKRPRFNEHTVRSFAGFFIVYLIFALVIGYAYPGNGGLFGFGTLNQDSSLMVVIGTSIIYGILAYGLHAGRRIAWRIATVLSGFIFAVLGLGALAQLTTETSTATVAGDILGYYIALYGIFFILLIVFRKHFNVHPNKATRRVVYRRLIILGALFFLLNTSFIYAFRGSFTPQPHLAQAAGEAVLRIFDLNNTIEPTTGFTKAYFNGVGILWFLYFAGSLAALIFTTYRARDDRSLFADYDALQRSKGTTSIGWMSRWKGMAYWINPTKTAGFGYHLENNIAIVLADPVGSMQAVRSSLPNFERSCHLNGWQPVFYAVSAPMKNMLSKHGYGAIQVGEDTIISVKDLEFTGKHWQSIRSSINRAQKEGISMRVVQYHSASIGLQDQLKTIAAGWAGDKSLPEMGFTLGTLNEADDPEVRMHLAIDEEGTVHGMTSWMPIYQKGKVVGWTIDIMQRRLGDATMQGVMEYLIAESALTFKQEGYDFISLSAAPLSHEGKANGPIEKLLDVVAERMEPYYGFTSLYRFKQKFNPVHEPMYLCYKDGAQLPAIAVAIGKAYMPDVSLKDLALSAIK